MENNKRHCHWPTNGNFLNLGGNLSGGEASLSGRVEKLKDKGDCYAQRKEVNKMNHFRPLLEELSYKSSLSYSFSKAIEFFKKGIGTSKKNIKNKFKYSPFIHSYETMERYIGIINNFKDTVLKDVKRINKISKEHINVHFNNLIEKKVTEKTIKVNASALIKLFFILGRKDLVDFIDESRQMWSQMARPSGRTIPFSNPEKVISCIKTPVFKSAAIIQYKTSARVSDIKKVVSWITTNPSARHIFIQKSKGGRDRVIDFSERMDELTEVLKAAFEIKDYFNSTNTNWTEFLKKYTYEVHRAANKCHEVYTGTHAFRANYAEKQYKEYTKESDDKKTQEKAFKRITEELGHSRIKMAKYYIL